MEMLAYEFYFRNKIKGDELIGILPERRKKPERVSHESVMKWAEIVFGEKLNISNIYFIPISLQKSAAGNYFPRI